MTRVLVTGATGLLGTTLVTFLKSTGRVVVSHGRSAGDLIGDLADFDSAKRVLSESRPDCIVNLVALTNVDECERSPHLAFVHNTRVVENLARAIRLLSSNRPHLIQVSTDQLYDGLGPHTEDAVTLTNYYAFSKYAGELAAGGVASTVLRTNFFGRSNLRGRMSFSDWLVNALSRGENLRVFADVRFSPLSINRLADIVGLAIDRRVVGVFNVGSRDGMSKADFCFKLAEVLGLPTTTMLRASVTDGKLVAHRPTDMRMDSSRFEEAFGLCLPTLEKEIESMKGCYDVKG